MNSSTSDHTSAKLSKKSTEHSKPLSMTFMDYENTYNSLEIWQSAFAGTQERGDKLLFHEK